MRKKFLVTFICIALMFLLFCSCVPRTYADDLPNTQEEPTTEQTTEQPVEEMQEEKVSVGEMFMSFLDKYLPSILAGLSSTPPLLFVYLFFRKKIKKMAEDVMNSTVLSKEEKDKSIEILNKANEKVDKAIEKIDVKAEEFEEINKKAEETFQKYEKREAELFEKFRISQELNTKLFSILAILVSQNPNLCNKGYAKEILELMENEKKEGD